MSEPTRIEQVKAELDHRLDSATRQDEAANKISAKYGSMIHLKQVPTITCVDGFTMSVQASAGHYCAPRDSEGPWEAVEVGFPSAREEALMPWVEDANDPTGTVYGYVPIEIVAGIIVIHGGFAGAGGMTPAPTTETKHTPGEWTLCQHLIDHDQCSCGYRGGIWGNGGSVMVCEIGAPNRDEGDDMIPRSSREVQFCDARLIAAAPDLLVAAKHALESDDVHASECLLLDAIAKAEGRQS